MIDIPRNLKQGESMWNDVLVKNGKISKRDGGSIQMFEVSHLDVKRVIWVISSYFFNTQKQWHISIKHTIDEPGKMFDIDGYNLIHKHRKKAKEEELLSILTNV